MLCADRVGLLNTAVRSTGATYRSTSLHKENVRDKRSDLLGDCKYCRPATNDACGHDDLLTNITCTHTITSQPPELMSLVYC